jgi:hypothetical protein
MTIIWKEFVAFVFGAMMRAWGVSQKRRRETWFADISELDNGIQWTFALCLPTEQHLCKYNLYIKVHLTAPSFVIQGQVLQMTLIQKE